MKVELRSWGGFTGKAGQEVRRVDLEQLSADGPELARLIDAAGFFTLPPKLLKPAPRSYDFQYELTVTAGDRKHTVTFHLDAAPAPLGEFVRRVTERVEKS